MILIAIDPGNTQSGLVVYDTLAARPTAKAKLPNAEVLVRIAEARRTIGAETVVVERIQARGMAVGQDTIDTAEWAGRFLQKASDAGLRSEGIFRRDVKMHLCGNNHAKDANIRRSLVDIYGPTEREAKGTKAQPGPLYGFAADAWAALAVARTFADTRLPKTPFHP